MTLHRAVIEPRKERQDAPQDERPNKDPDDAAEYINKGLI